MSDGGTYFWQIIFRHIGQVNSRFFLLAFILAVHLNASAEGTRQLEPQGAPAVSICRITLSQYSGENRIPFALLNCSEEYRLNVRIKDFTSEKIYLGLGDMIDYYDPASIFTDVKYQIKDPAGNAVVGYSLKPTPLTGETGFIQSSDQAMAGPDIAGTNPSGYEPLIIVPSMNGDYCIEFKIPSLTLSEMRVIQYIDVTVAKGLLQIPGRLWSKAWQFSSGSVHSYESSSHAKFYVYTNDSIVTSFDCNGLAGGVWAVYSNEWGCSTTGTWSSRRQSIEGNASVEPQHKIFLNDPDSLEFVSGEIGEMLDFKVLPHECDTIITFWAEMSKAGNIEILLDVPPLNPNSFAPEDVQLGYHVLAGSNTLSPGWDGKNAYGIPLLNGTLVEARIRFLNGLSNIPLFDVEDNPKGFKVNIVRPLPASPSTKLKLFWDDTRLPSSSQPNINVINGCEYTGIEPISGCHEWTFEQDLGDENTINSWWYFTSGSSEIIPITLKLSPPSGLISGPANICSGMLASFSTHTIPFAQKYYWHINGPGFSYDIEKNAPDTSFVYQFTASMPQGNYIISVYGSNPQCGDGEKAFFTSFVYDDLPPPINGETTVCKGQTSEFLIPGTYSSIQWEFKNGIIVGSPHDNPVLIRWNTTGNDTIKVLATNADCGTRLSVLPVVVYQPADAGFSTSGEATTCPGLPINFNDTSSLASGTITERIWMWDDGQYSSGNLANVSHIYTNTGSFTAILEVTTDKGCKTEASRQIRVIPYPEASFSSFRNCVSHAIQLTDKSTGTDIAYYNWNFGNAMVTTANLNEKKPLAIFHATGQFPVQMIVTNKYGCSDTVIQLIKIHDIPKAGFSYGVPCQSAGIIFSDQSSVADTVINQYYWTVNSIGSEEKIYEGTPAMITFADAKNYDVELLVSDALGCADTIIKQVSVKAKPVSAFDYIENVGNIMGKLQFINQTTGAIGYNWNFGNSITTTIFDPEIKYTVEGDYSIMLIATSLDGCNDTAIRHYYYMPGLWMPNAFTPDSDGLNDVFRPVTQRISLKPYLLNVYNRWGQLVFTTTDPGTAWDGTLNSEPCQAGNYSYIIQYKEDKIESSDIITQRGMVSLIR